MKRFFILTLLAVSVNLFSQDINYALRTIDTLSSEFFSGRGYVNGGTEKAANFIGSEFRSFRLTAFTNNYYQTFTIPINTFPKSVKLSINGDELKGGIDFLIDPASTKGKGDFDVTTVEAKDLLKEAVLKKILTKSKGKYVVIDRRGLETDIEKINSIIDYLKYKKELPISGIIELVDHKLTWHLSTQLGVRPVFTVKSLLELRKIKSIGINVENMFISDYECSNVVGYVKGSYRPDSFIVITAHYDHLGMMGSKVMFPGANDNASGIAMLCSLAKYFSENTPKYSIVFIALAAEEAGLLGAKYFVENPLFALSQIKFLINFDLAGTGGEGIKVVNGSVFKEQFEQLSDLNQEGHYLADVKVRGEACNSDHCMFYKKGVPCFYIYTLGGNKAYHDIYDVPINLPLDSFSGYKQLMIDFIGSF